MSSPLPSNVQKCREHLVASNRCGDRSPDLRFGAVTGGGRPITSGMPPAQNHFTINITNQPGALIDVGKLNEIASATLPSASALPPAPATQPLLRTNLGPNDLRRSLHHRTATFTGQPAPDNQFPPAPPSVALPATGSYFYVGQTPEAHRARYGGQAYAGSSLKITCGGCLGSDV